MAVLAAAVQEHEQGAPGPASRGSAAVCGSVRATNRERMS